MRRALTASLSIKPNQGVLVPAEELRDFSLQMTKVGDQWNVIALNAAQRYAQEDPDDGRVRVLLYSDSHKYTVKRPFLCKYYKSLSMFSKQPFCKDRHGNNVDLGYIASDEKMKCVKSGGKSGSIIFFTSDRSFVIKSLGRTTESKFVRSILPKYYQHLENNKNTLLPRLYSIFSVSVDGGKAQMYFYVTDNVFSCFNGGSVSRSEYDLKGSSKDRTASKSEREKHSWKDNDLLEYNGPYHRRYALLHRHHVDYTKLDELYVQLTSDVYFLKDNGIMDYSLLVGIVQEGQATATQAEQSPSLSVLKTEYSTVALGIIDILQPWTAKKKAAMHLKSTVHKRSTLSTVPPPTYGDRFLAFMKEHVIGA